jgi:hypothetical protein
MHSRVHASLLAVGLALVGCGGIAVIDDTEETDSAPDVDLGPSTSRWSFELPSEGTPNDNGYIGPFCCTGVTAVVTTEEGDEIGYAYFFSWEGQAFTNGETSFAPDFQIFLQGRVDLEDEVPPFDVEDGELSFTAGELVPGLSRTADVGGLRFTATILNAEVGEWSTGPMFDMGSLTVRLDVDPLE